MNEEKRGLMLEHRQQGQVFFIRHGESTSNERNIFAGILDVELTDFGKAQAQRAGTDLLKKNVRIDAVFVSHMRRAQQTCEIAMNQSRAVISPMSAQIDHRLAERSFGIFANLNYNLLRCSLGYRHFESMLHSPDEAPPAGEPIANIYERFVLFYEEMVAPRLARGENVLVVSHQYLLEAAVLYLCRKRPQEYHHLKLPNGKALSREELIQYYSEETSRASLFRKELNDKLAMSGVPLMGLAFLAGAASKAFFGLPAVPGWIFSLLILIGLGISSFYTYLDLDFKRSAKNVSRPARWTGFGLYLLRWAPGLALLWFNLANGGVFDHSIIFAILFCLVPPALSSPVLSVLWGGNLYPAAVISRLLSFGLPACLLLLAAMRLIMINTEPLLVFLATLVAGLLLPAFLAQTWRTRAPVNSHRHSKEWRFLAVIAMICAGGLAGYQFVPASLISDLTSDAVRNSICVQQLILSLEVLVGLRGLGLMGSLLCRRFLKRREGIDLYILCTTPNFFLWSSLLIGSGELPLQYLLFWLGVGFFCLPVLEQGILVTTFRRDLLKEALRSSRMDGTEIRKIFEKLDSDGDGRLGRQELAQFVSMVERNTLGERRKNRVTGYLTEYLLLVMDLNRSGAVEWPEWESYLSAHGLVVNLNPPRPSTKSVRRLHDHHRPLSAAGKKIAQDFAS